MSNYSKCFDDLENSAKSKGYLTSDDIIDAADSYELSVTEIDELSEKLLLNGIIISDNPPQEDDSQDTDYSRLDYDKIYNEIISIDPGLEHLVSIIRELPTPQKGEIAELYAKMEYYDFKGTHAGEARERLISIHMRAVLKIALSLSKQFGYELSDAISTGFVGLIDAVKKYDPKQNESKYFGTYVNQFIWGFITRDCQPKWIHKIPPHLMDRLLTLIKMFNDFYGISTELYVPEYDFLLRCSERLGESIEQIKSYFEMILSERNSLSIDEYIESEDEYQYNSSLVIDYNPIWEDSVYNFQILLTLSKALETIPERQLQVIKLRYGIGCEPLTLDEIGRKLNVTRERIRQIEDKALKSLRNNRYMKRLKFELFPSESDFTVSN